MSTALTGLNKSTYFYFEDKSFWSNIYCRFREKLQFTHYIPHLRKAIFPTNHIKVEKLIGSRVILKNYGGQFLKIKTSDKEAILDGCLIEAKDFRNAVIAKGGKFSRLKDGTPIFVLPNDHSVRNQILEEMKIDPSRVEKREAIVDDESVAREPACYPCCKRKKHKEHYIPLRTNPKAKKIGSRSKTIVIPFGGNGMSYEMDRRKMFECLLMGQSVFACNPRGYAHSTGIPSEMGLYNDVDSIHQFTSQSVDHTDKVYWGYCQGAAPASYGASHYASKQTHFIGERCFSKERDLLPDLVESFAAPYLVDESIDKTVQDFSEKCSMCTRVFSLVGEGLKFPFVKKGVKKVAVYIIDLITPNYENANRVKKMQGSVLLIHGSQDTLVTQKTKKAFQKQVRQLIPEEKQTIIEEKGLKHCGALSEETYDLIAGHLNAQRLTANYPSDDVPDDHFIDDSVLI